MKPMWRRVGKSLLIFSSLLIIIFVPGCYEKIDWVSPSIDPRPVVNSIIKNGEPILVKVSTTVAFDSRIDPSVENASVLLFVDDTFAEVLECVEDGLYTSSILAREGSEYRCEVSIPGQPVAICSTVVPKPQAMVNIEYINKAGVDEEGRTFPGIKVTFENQPEIRQYFEVVIYQDYYGIFMNPSLQKIIDPVLLNEGLPIAVFSNDLIRGKNYTMIIHYSTGSASKANNEGWVTNLFPLQVELRTINYDYYQFIKDQYLYETATASPIFSVGVTPTFKLHGNVLNGYGIFTAYSAVISDVINP